MPRNSQRPVSSNHSDFGRDAKDSSRTTKQKLVQLPKGNVRSDARPLGDGRWMLDSSNMLDAQESVRPLWVQVAIFLTSGQNYSGLTSRAWSCAQMSFWSKAVKQCKQIAVSHYSIQYPSLHRPQLFLLFQQFFLQCPCSPLPINVLFLFVPIVLPIFFRDFIQVVEEFGG